ncbi:hypothetical protein EDB85DRAFT_1377142 [Lactarius pseudohatsudake]|nr:hypothetical protein EDB85DRAFT_1377142 [Lactarius pseudohatsudake]
MDRSYGHGEGRIWEENQDAEVHSTTSAAMQVATDHAFTGSYVQRFYTNEVGPTRKHQLPIHPTTHLQRHSQHGVEPHPPPPTPASSPPGKGPRSCASSSKTRAPSQNPNPVCCLMCPPNPTESPETGVCIFPVIKLSCAARTRTRTRNSASAYVPRVALAAAPCVTCVFRVSASRLRATYLVVFS